MIGKTRSKIKEYEEQIKMVIHLSIPAILAEISAVIMQYIDSVMVGSLGATATAAIGIVSSSTWLIGGLCIGAATGFSVQVAQMVGAGEYDQARNVLRQSIIACLFVSLVMMVIGMGISRPLPIWLGGEAAICENAGIYFLIYAASLPAIQFRYLSGSMLQCSGEMKIPGILNALMCGLDVIFNALLIFPSRTISLFGMQMFVPGAGMGVTGAALGTALSEVVIAVVMMWFVCFRSETMKVTGHGSWRLHGGCVKTAAKIALPISFEHTVMCGAQVAATYIIAPLGTISVAANSLAVTAESFCYMPGYGIGTAATTLVGQSIGAGRKDLAKSYGWISVGLGMVIMSGASVIMYIFAPEIFMMLTPDEAVRELGTKVLRIEAFAEPMYAASIVAAGALRGAGDTLVPSFLNLFSMWGIRITATIILAPRFGLVGVWIAMCTELCVRGMLFLVRMIRGKWLQMNILK